ncbi:MAG: hypothetical protein O7E57_01830 [Gammaproteobacteria bacterium]|nr:hypothetical protein [Gammaproteobacteria bacterium]
MRAVARALLLLLSSQVVAHQPVMDMAPRWEGGYGIQTRVERFDSRTTTWLEGVYTLRPSTRVTFKLPYVDDELRNVIIGVPLKKYTNRGAFTSNWSVTPSVQFPTADEGEWDVGLSISYSASTPSSYKLYDLYVWNDRVGLDINVGIHPVHNNSTNSGLFAIWDVSMLASSDGDRVQTGPVLMFYWQNVMARLEYKALVYERDSNWSGGYFGFGIGAVF